TDGQTIRRSDGRLLVAVARGAGPASRTVGPSVRPPLRHRFHTLRTGVVLALAACASSGGSPADLVIRHATIYTVDSLNPAAQALAVKDGRMVFVGTDSGVRRWIGERTRVLDLPGRFVMPGFIDTHVHPVTGGIKLGECHLNDAASREDLVRTIAGCRPQAGWVRGAGWDLPIFPGGMPGRELLDSLTAYPAYLISSDGHSAWVNSRALEIAGIGPDTPDPVNGRIERDRSGRPSGTLRETAMDLVARHLPAYGADEYYRGLGRALTLAIRSGITTLHEAAADENILAAYHRADSLGRLKIRVIAAIRVSPDSDIAGEVARLSDLRARYTSEHVRPVAAKIFLDGVIEGQTAALLAPYLDRPGYLGELNFSPDHLTSLVHALDSAGFKVHIHAIGDRAIRTALDAFEAQTRLDRGAGPRHIMAHIQLWGPADLPRPARLGVVMSFQPLWAYADSYIRDLTVPRLGPARSRWLYPIRSVIETGAIVAGGSDWPVTSMNPLDAIQVAVTRRALNDSTGPAWIPEERIDLATALRMYTAGGAMASDLEQEIGMIRMGRLADLVVLSADPFAVPPGRIHEIEVVATVAGGEIVTRTED
ncbi:MAG: amidohydrolase, partial [Gemmatimonadales bacterium]